MEMVLDWCETLDLNINYKYFYEKLFQTLICIEKKICINLENILSAQATDRNSYCVESSNSYRNEYTTGIAGVSWQRYSIKSGRCKYNGQFDNNIIMSE